MPASLSVKDSHPDHCPGQRPGCHPHFPHPLSTVTKYSRSGCHTSPRPVPWSTLSCFLPVLLLSLPALCLHSPQGLPLVRFLLPLHLSIQSQLLTGSCLPSCPSHRHTGSLQLKPLTQARRSRPPLQSPGIEVVPGAAAIGGALRPGSRLAQQTGSANRHTSVWAPALHSSTL